MVTDFCKYFYYLWGKQRHHSDLIDFCQNTKDGKLVEKEICKYIQLFKFQEISHFDRKMIDIYFFYQKLKVMDIDMYNSISEILTILFDNDHIDAYYIFFLRMVNKKYDAYCLKRIYTDYISLSCIKNKWNFLEKTFLSLSVLCHFKNTEAVDDNGEIFCNSLREDDFDPNILFVKMWKLSYDIASNSSLEISEKLGYLFDKSYGKVDPTKIANIKFFIKVDSNKDIIIFEYYK